MLLAFLKQQRAYSIGRFWEGNFSLCLRRHKIPHVTLPVDSKNPFVVAFNAFRIARLIRKHHVNIVHARSRLPHGVLIGLGKGRNGSLQLFMGLIILKATEAEIQCSNDAWEESYCTFSIH